MTSKLAIFGGPPALQCTPAEYLPLHTNETSAVLNSLYNSPLTTLYGGFDVAKLEEDFATRFRVPYAVAMSSGTASLHAACAALGIGPGDEVIVPTYSFVASVSCVVQQGATPIFCDIESNSLGIDANACERAITGRTRAVILVHINGLPAEVGRVKALCQSRNIRLIEDCAGAIGSRQDGIHVGGFGDVGCFSFNARKILRVGEGGMAVCSDLQIAEELRAVRVNGLRAVGQENVVTRLGYNYTLSQPIAALATSALTRFDENLARRRANAARLRKLLSNIPLAFCECSPSSERVDYLTTMLLPSELAPFRTAIIRAAHAEGVPLGAGYGDALYTIKYLAPFATGQCFPVTEDVVPRILTIDPAPHLNNEHIDGFAEGLTKIFNSLERLVTDL